MERKQIINGKVYDWSSVTIGVSGCNGIEPQGIDYGDEKEKTLVYRRGGKIAGFGTGDQKNSVKLTLFFWSPEEQRQADASARGLQSAG